MIAVNITAVRVQMGEFLVDHHSCPLMFVMNFFWLKGELAVKNRIPTDPRSAACGLKQIGEIRRAPSPGCPCQNRKSKSFDRPMRQPSDWVVWCYKFDAIAAFPGRSAPKWRSADKRCVDLQLEARCQRSPKARLRMLIQKRKLQLSGASWLKRQTATSEV